MKRASARDLKNALGIYFSWVASRPFYTTLNVASYCNLSCQGCDYPRLKEDGLLPEQPTKETLTDRFSALYRVFGSQMLSLSDYEPTTLLYLEELIEAAAQRHSVGITTNGTLITEEMAQRFWKKGMQFAGVSLPSIHNERYQEIIGTKRYTVNDVQSSIETLIKTGPRKLRRVSILATIDNFTSPHELEEFARYATDVHASLSFQLYSPEKKNVSNNISDEADEREIKPETLDARFGGSLSGYILGLQERYPVIYGRSVAIKNFDTYVLEGSIPWKPRSLSLDLNGGIALHPEGKPFAFIDSSEPHKIKNAYWGTVYNLRANGENRADSCYRCTNVTNPSTPLGDWFVNILTCLGLERAVRFA